MDAAEALIAKGAVGVVNAVRNIQVENTYPPDKATGVQQGPRERTPSE